jgi:hypothetical protein
MMTDDEMTALTSALVGPVRELLDRMTTLIEKLTNRVEVLELESLHRRDLPPPLDGDDDETA